ncbi:MAG TPA: BatD family protein, partial [Arenibacter sp.]|nr:BatD family protein [Arenibacter sp.]
VTVVYKLFASPTIDVTNFRALDNPKYNDFWSQDIPVTKYNIQDETYNGKPFRSVILKRVVLYPQKTGELDLEPLSLDVSIQVPTNKRDFFGGRILAQANKTVSAGKRTITVKALPTEGRPANFSGAVGEFDFSVTASKTHLNASESLQAVVGINGKGNLKLFEIPKLNLPSSLEVYDPEFNENVRTNLSGMEGKVSNSYTVVPTFRGKYPIPSISFSYFNPRTEKYHTLTSEEVMINVVEGPTSGSISATEPGGLNRQRVIAASDQFVFNKLTPNLKAVGTDHFFGSLRFYMWWLGPLALIPLAILFGKKREALASDVEGNKIKRANRLAKKYLSAAKKALGSKDSFYVALEKALHNYLKAKLKIETSEFSKDKIATLLTEKEVDIATKEGFVGLLENCEMARYSPFSDVQMQQDYNRASEVISQLDKQI